MNDEKLLVWLPSPMGDAVLATPALRAIRKQFPKTTIYFLAGPAVRQLLCPNIFNDEWIEIKSTYRPALISTLKKHDFISVILLKNSFGSALFSYLAKIPKRTGYTRDARSFLLTDKIQPLKNPDGTFKPASMIDYYLKIAEHLGCDISEKQMQLPLDTAEVLEIFVKKGYLERFLDAAAARSY